MGFSNQGERLIGSLRGQLVGLGRSELEVQLGGVGVQRWDRGRVGLKGQQGRDSQARR